MIKRLLSLCLLLCPILALAEDTISFAPPVTDYSISWLASIFGVVDGVLNGSGSQIVGRMFSVFNAAVMALGGIIITYTMLVSTLNTAHEGEMLGKKWSSIWVPVRATAGFALLIPKASGYCLLQVFVMWIVVQGVGAADKLWDTALGYLNRGGVIIQAQQTDPSASMIGSTPSEALTDGAIRMLSGQVCMLTVEKLLKNKYEEYHNNGESSECKNNTANPDIQMFCSAAAVPSFVDSIDFKASMTTTGTTYNTNMPNFLATTYPFYSQFNGICGTINWNALSAYTAAQAKNYGLTSGEKTTILDTRAIALQQMYTDLLLVAEVMVNNDPAFATVVPTPAPVSSTKHANTSNGLTGVFSQAQQVASTSTQPAKPWATDPFGYPLRGNNTRCTASGEADCTSWGTTTSGSGGALLNGTELVGAVLDYERIMKSTLTLLSEMNKGQGSDSRNFISGAKASGWIMAGSYFFDLVQLNTKNVSASQSVTGDPDSGLEKSTFNLSTLNSAFPNVSTNTTCSGASTPSDLLCNILNGKATDLNPIVSLFTGQSTTAASDVITPSPATVPNVSTLKAPTIPAIPVSSGSTTVPQTSNSVFGYAQNALVITVPGQPPTPPLKFANMMHASFSGTSFKMPSANFSCMGIDLFLIEICLGRMIGNIIYNDIIVLILNTITAWLESWVYGLVMNMLMIPLDAMAAIFTQGINILNVPGINPVVALAQMGTYYINFVGKLWFMVLFNQFVTYVVSIIGLPLVPLMFMALPITIAWSLIMLGVGMITAYYVPLIPYMIFLFGSIAWFMAVIEAMVAAPIVALGVIHPEGHDIFGKGEAAIMILMNVFLRPAMMIIGFITAISISYVGIWVLNAGFDRAVSFIQPSQSSCDQGQVAGKVIGDIGAVAAGAAMGGGAGVVSGVTRAVGAAATGAASIGGNASGANAGESTGLDCTKSASSDSGLTSPVPGAGTVSGGYTQWAGVFAFLFSILIYTTIYMTIVEKAFTLISALPDNVLRWIGGQPERHGDKAEMWVGESKKGVEKAEGDAQKAMTQAGKTAQAQLTPKPPKKGGITGDDN